MPERARALGGDTDLGDDVSVATQRRMVTIIGGNVQEKPSVRDQHEAHYFRNIFTVLLL